MSTAPSREAVERRLGEIWADVLGVERVEPDDDFFRLGGSSLSAVRIATQASAAFGGDVAPEALFSSRTLVAFARVVEAAAPARAPPRGRVHDEPSEREAAIWAWSHYGGPSLLACGAYLLEGPLDVRTLERAFTELARRHEILRTIYPSDHGRPRAEVLEPQPVRVALIDVSGEPRAERERRVQAERERARSEPTDYAVKPPLRISVVRLAADAHVLILRIHEIVCDGQGLVPFMRDLSLAYDALATDGPSPFAGDALQYRDAIDLQRAADAPEGHAYWERMSEELPVRIALPVRAAGPGPLPDGPVSAVVELDPALTARLKSIAQGQAATPFMAYLAVLYVLLHRYSGDARLVVRSPAANRTQAALEDVVGMFARIVPICVELRAGMSLRALLDATRDAALPAFRYGNQLPLTDPLRRIAAARGLNEGLPVLRLHERPEPVPTFAGIRTTQLAQELPTSALTVEVTEHGMDAPTSVKLTSHLREIDAQGLATMAVRYRRLTERLVEDADSPIELLDVADEEPAAAPRAAAADVSLHALVERQAHARGAAPAIRSSAGVLSYEQLDARADALAAHLRAQGLAPQARVGVALAPSAQLVVALLAVLKAGAICVPLASDHAAAAHEGRALELLLVDGGAPVAPAAAVVDLSTVELAPAGRPDQDEAPAVGQPQQVAFEIPTAGVTGPPRTIHLTHATLVELAAWQRATYELTCDDVGLHAPGPGVLTWALTPWALLASGAVVVVPEPAEDAADDLSLAALAPHEASRRFDDPTGAHLPSRLLIVHGHGALTLPQDPARAGLRIVRQYAVAEAGGAVLAEDVERSTGRWDPVTAAGAASVRGALRVLDADGHLLPAGAVGELCVDGCRTGDLGCRFADGGVQFQGRVHDRVKLRGFPLNAPMDEIERALARHSRIRAAVAYWDEATAALVAAIVPVADPPSVRELDRWLREQTDTSVLPARYVAVDAVPLRPDASPDRATLAEVARAPGAVALVRSASGGRTQRRLLRLWRQVLGRRELDVHDNFFAAGGTFPLGVELAARARRAGVPLEPRMLLIAPTVAELVELLEER